MIKKVCLLSLLLISCSLSQNLSNNYYFAFGLENAKIDSSLSSEIRAQFEDDDGSLPLKSISVDLNNDGVAEKLIPNEFLCGSGGCPWLVYSSKLKKVVGQIGGSVLYIDTKQKNGYYIIEAYWGGGAGEGSVYFYEYSKGKYDSVNRIDLKDGQIDKYFDKKKSLKK